MDRVWRSASIFVEIHAARCHRGYRSGLACDHVDYVAPVAEQVCDLAAAEIEVGAEYPELLRVPIAPLYRPQETGPIEVRRLVFPRRFHNVHRVLPPPAAHAD